MVAETHQSIEHLKRVQDDINTPIATIQSTLMDAGLDGEFPVSRTLIAQNVWYRSNEDLERVAKTIIHKALDLPNINIARVERKSGSRSGKGLIKIELNSKADIECVLRKKGELRHNPMEEIRDVFLRKSKRDDVLLMEQNVDTILRDMGVCDDYMCLSSGKLVKKDPARRRSTLNHDNESSRYYRENSNHRRGSHRGRGGRNYSFEPNRHYNDQ